jgi:DNA polymerase elongation subunit (family B)
MTKLEFLNLCEIEDKSDSDEKQICDFARQIFDKQLEIEEEFDYHHLQEQYPNYEIGAGSIEISNIDLINQKMSFNYEMSPFMEGSYHAAEFIEINIDSLFVFDEEKFKKITESRKLFELEQQIFNAEKNLENLKQSKKEIDSWA